MLKNRHFPIDSDIDEERLASSLSTEIHEVSASLAGKREAHSWRDAHCISIETRAQSAANALCT